MSDRKSSDSASEQYRFFIYDPAGWGFQYYRTAEDRNAARGTIIQSYLDEGWDEEVENVIAGEVTHICQKTEVEKRPDQVDEDGLDADGNYWAEEWDEKCNYDLVPLGRPTPQAWLDVQAERRRQVEEEGWTPEHDDEHDDGKIAEEAAGFLMNGQSPRRSAWSWKHKHTDSPTRASRRRQLVIGVALGLAEIERLDRATAPEQGGSDHA